MLWYEQYESQMSNIIEYAKLCYDRKLVSAAGGNVSMRCAEGFLITASNVSLRAVNKESIILCGLNDHHVIHGEKGLRPSKESPFHMNIYKYRKNINCVIHVHPNYATAFTYYKKELPLFTVSAKLKLHNVPIIAQAPPGSSELANNIAQAVGEAHPDTNAFLLEGHGILVMGESMEECFHSVELLEDAAHIAMLLHL